MREPKILEEMLDGNIWACLDGEEEFARITNQYNPSLEMYEDVVEFLSEQEVVFILGLRKDRAKKEMDKAQALFDRILRGDFK